jgi:hypothetical protein
VGGFLEECPEIQTVQKLFLENCPETISGIQKPFLD